MKHNKSSGKDNVKTELHKHGRAALLENYNGWENIYELQKNYLKVGQKHISTNT